ncbi:hypothetical protein EPN52_09185 [bacterium]|nr:MAG: hypothetical protein EPN52_09185 [bacterium]
MADHDPLEKALGDILKGIEPLPSPQQPARPRTSASRKRRKGAPDLDADPEAWDRYRTCERKRAYPTETAARLDALRQRRRLFVYRCRFCDKFHLTSQGGENA